MQNCSRKDYGRIQLFQHVTHRSLIWHYRWQLIRVQEGSRKDNLLPRGRIAEGVPKHCKYRSAEGSRKDFYTYRFCTYPRVQKRARPIEVAEGSRKGKSGTEDLRGSSICIYYVIYV